MLIHQSIFTPLEQAVLGAICESHPEDRTALDAQLPTATFGSRENTGVGFYVRFNVDQESSAQIRGAQLKNGPRLRSTDWITEWGLFSG